MQLDPPFFFIDKDSYSPYGFSAIKDFDFSVLKYLKTFSFVFFFLYSVTFSIYILRKFLPIKFTFIKKDTKGIQKSGNTITTIKLKNLLYLVLFIFLLAFMNYWMFNNSIGLTGIESPRLPFKMSGILFFFSRFIAPILLIMLYSRTKRSFLVAIFLLIYALWAGLTQVSRTTLTMFWLPVIFFALVDKRYVLLLISISLFLIVFPYIETARNYVYKIDSGVVGINSANSIFSISSELLQSKDIISIKGALFGFVGRLGGTQDVVLADQYDNSDIGNSFMQFSRVFFLSKKMDLLKLQTELYGFTPPEGFSPGDGALTASVLIISNKNFIVLFLTSFFVALIIHFNEFILKSLSIRLNYSVVTNFLALLFNLILVPRLSYIILYGYMAVVLILILILNFEYVQGRFKKYHIQSLM